MKEITGKTKWNPGNLPKMIKTEKGNIYDQRKIAEEFNTFFTNIGPKLASKITPVPEHFQDYIIKSNFDFDNNELSFKEFDTAFKSLKRNKASGIDDINTNVVIDVYNEIKQLLFKICQNSVKEGTFPDPLKIAKVSPIFKTGDAATLGNYRPISVLPVFSKLLERIMYNRVYSYFKTNNLFYTKRFGFQKNTSTEHAILQLVNEITENFSHNEFTLGVFIDLSKAFDTVDHDILLKKLEYYGTKGNAKKWFESYLQNRKQCIIYNGNNITSFCTITCGVPQGSILGPLLFLIYVNDFFQASTEMSAVMFADDTNLFMSDKNIINLYTKMNIELEKVSAWFKANKLSLNVSKTKYSLFHQTVKKKNIPTNLPFLQINNINIERNTITKFLGVLIDENLNWKAQLANIESKISKSVGILYKAN